MKNIYKENVEIYIDGFGKDWIYGGSIIKYIQDSEAKECTENISDFKYLYSLVDCGLISIARTDETFLGKRKMIKIWNFDTISVTEKDFKGAKIRFRYEKMNSYTFEYLMKNLNSEQFIEYCKDRNFLFDPSFFLDK